MRLMFFSVFMFLSTFCFAQTAQRAVLVTAGDVFEGVIQPTIDITGSVYFTEASNVASDSSGKVLKMYINEGDSVSKGDILAELDSSAVSFNLDAAKARTQLALLTKDKSKRDYDRNEVLYKAQSISEQKYQDSFTDYKIADNSYLAAFAEEKRLTDEKNKMTIRTPFAGVVTSKNLSAGEWVSSGGTVANVAALDFEAQIYLPEKILSYVKIGAPISIVTEAGEFKGKVSSVNSKGEPSTRTFLSRIYIGKDNKLKEGLLATGRIPAGKDTKSLMVVRDAVIDRSGVKGVFKIGEGNIVKFIPVNVLGYSGSNTAIKSDALSIGDRVVISGNNLINNGSLITLSAK